MKAERLFQKIAGIASKAGRKAVELALTLFYCMRDKDTPPKIKAIILGDLVYLVAPFDAIVDFLPIAGYSDDLAVMVATLAAVTMYVKDEHKQKARSKVDEWLRRAPEAQPEGES